MPYVSRRTMRIYRRLDQYLFKPVQILAFTMAGLCIGYLVVGLVILALAGKS